MSLGEDNPCIPDAIRYIEVHDWWIVPVRGPGSDAPKAPIYDAWPVCRPSTQALAQVLHERPLAGIALHLGGSGLVDVEADGPVGEDILADACREATCPSWASRRGTHRLFRADPGFPFRKSDEWEIEFRAGPHISILPPSIHEDGQFQRRWIVSPFHVDPPPLPPQLIDLYHQLPAPSGDTGARPSNNARPPRFPFRDNLDYIYRYHDLMAIAAAAGIEFVYCHPDRYGNVPCYVPSILRGGNSDEHPSGVFNARNGRMRDFATGINHRFLDVIAALTGRRWIDVFHDLQKAAGRHAIRPHSGRLCLPQPQEDQPARLTVEEARDKLRKYVVAELSREPVPKRLHIIKGPPGLGKTTVFCEVLAALNTPAIILTLENRLADLHARVIGQAGGDMARRMPILRQTPCPHPDEYETTARLGYQPSQSLPCQRCTIGPRHCPYLLAFGNLADAKKLCCAAVYHTHGDFYSAYDNEKRKVVIFDESCIDLLLAPVSHPLAAWRSWGRLVQRLHETRRGKPCQHTEPLLALIRWLTDAGRQLLEQGDKLRLLPVPTELAVPYMTILPGLQRHLHRLASKTRFRKVPNLYSHAVYLLSQPGSCVFLERVGQKHHVRVRFRRRHPLPEDREVFILDATADETLIRAAAPGWDVRVWDCPRLAQQGEIIQIMDYDTSRNFMRKEVKRHREHVPCWTAQVMDAILAGTDEAALVSFKAVATDRRQDVDILAGLKYADKIRYRNHFPCRGITVPSKVLIVLGTPYKDQTTVLELAVALYGHESFATLEYRRQERLDDCFVAANMGYGDPRLAAIQGFLVSSDLVQAIGRVRPLQNEASVFLLSNAAIPDWTVTQYMASELFDLRTTLRSDGATNYDRYVSEVMRRLDKGEAVGNPDVCRAINMNLRTGRGHMKHFQNENAERLMIEKKKIMWAP